MSRTATLAPVRILRVRAPAPTLPASVFSPDAKARLHPVRTAVRLVPALQ